MIEGCIDYEKGYGVWPENSEPDDEPHPGTN